MRYLVFFIFVFLFGSLTISCQDDPIDEISSQKIYTDNLYHLDGSPYVTTPTPTCTCDPFTEIIEYTFNAEEATTGTATGPEKITTNGTNIDYTTLNYDDSSEEIAYWAWVVPDIYNGGSVQMTIHWITSATSGAVYWGCGANEYGDSDTFDVSWPEDGSTVVTTADPAAGDLNTTVFTWFVPSSTWDSGDLIFIGIDRLAQLAPDTMVGDAKVIDLNLEVHAELGS